MLPKNELQKNILYQFSASWRRYLWRSQFLCVVIIKTKLGISLEIFVYCLQLFFISLRKRFSFRIKTKDKSIYQFHQHFTSNFLFKSNMRSFSEHAVCVCIFGAITIIHVGDTFLTVPILPLPHVKF